MTLQLVEDALGDPRNAAALALASDLAYFPLEVGAKKFADELGLTEAQLFSVGNTQAYVATNADHIVVAFRGTEAPCSIEGLKDWLLTDALNLLVVPEGRLGTDLAAAGVGARFHQGFVNAIADIWDPVRTAVEAELKKKERPLWITGHSLGGALALFAAWLFARKMINVHQIYTYGAPMIGNVEASKAFDREFSGKIFRYVNTLDPIPQLPTMSLIANQYGHCQTEVALGTAGASFLAGLAANAVDGILNASLVDTIWKSLQERVGAHAMDVYRQQLKG
jgi:hypothetical protein